LDVEQARFNEGVYTALTLIDYERDLAQAQSSEVSALGVYAKAKAALERAVGLTLKTIMPTSTKLMAGGCTGEQCLRPPIIKSIADFFTKDYTTNSGGSHGQE
jgi:hypothetical protein